MLATDLSRPPRTNQQQTITQQQRQHHRNSTNDNKNNNARPTIDWHQEKTMKQQSDTVDWLLT
jgi:hypothetical protein